jgi:branched-chain amino acid transport system ATP-binding protein
MGMVIVEQDIVTALRVARRIYCFREGLVVLEGTSGDLRREQISQAYFGLQ